MKKLRSPPSQKRSRTRTPPRRPATPARRPARAPAALVAKDEALAAAGHLAPPATGTARAAGLAGRAAEVLRDLDALVVQELPQVQAVRLTRHPAVPAVVLLELPAGTRWTGQGRRHEGGVLVDAREAGARVRLSPGAARRGQDWVLELSPEGGLDLWQVVHAPGQEASVDVAALLGGDDAEAWLLEAVRRRAGSLLVLDRLAAVGLLARLWVPTRGHAAAQERLAAGDGPPARAMAWAGRLGRAVAAKAVKALVAEAGRLAQALEPLCGSLAAGGPGGREALLAWLHARDDLASAEVLLSRSAVASAAAEALATLDAEAGDHLTALGSVDVSGDRRLAAVSWQEPERWWGALAARG